MPSRCDCREAEKSDFFSSRGFKLSCDLCTIYFDKCDSCNKNLQSEYKYDPFNDIDLWKFYCSDCELEKVNCDKNSLMDNDERVRMSINNKDFHEILCKAINDKEADKPCSRCDSLEIKFIADKDRIVYFNSMPCIIGTCASCGNMWSHSLEGLGINIKEYSDLKGECNAIKNKEAS